LQLIANSPELYRSVLYATHQSIAHDSPTNTQSPGKWSETLHLVLRGFFESQGMKIVGNGDSEYSKILKQFLEGVGFPLNKQNDAFSLFQLLFSLKMRGKRLVDSTNFRTEKIITYNLPNAEQIVEKTSLDETVLRLNLSNENNSSFPNFSAALEHHFSETHGTSVKSLGPSESERFPCTYSDKTVFREANLPDNLLIRLERWQAQAMEHAGEKMTKDSTSFEYPLSFCFPRTKTNYALHAVICHKGLLETGHYSTIIIDPAEPDSCQIFDDEKVSVGVTSEVLSKTYGGSNDAWAAYILAYRKI